LQFEIVSSTARVQALETMFSKWSLQFQIVSNIINMHTLETLLGYLHIKYFDHLVIVF